MIKTLIILSVMVMYLVMASVSQAFYYNQPYQYPAYQQPIYQPMYQPQYNYVQPFYYQTRAYGQHYFDQVRSLTQGNLNFVSQFQFAPMPFMYQQYWW